MHDIFSQSRICVHVFKALGHPTQSPVVAGQEDVRVRKHQHLQQHEFNGIRHSVLICPLVESVSRVEQLQNKRHTTCQRYYTHTHLYSLVY